MRLRADRRPGSGDRRESEDKPDSDGGDGAGCRNQPHRSRRRHLNGFMVGKDAEWSGIIRAGAKMVSAVSTSVVPKIVVIVGGSFGAGHYAMCGKAYDPRFLFAWPTARYAVMSGASAAFTLAEIRARQMERGWKVVSAAEKKVLFEACALNSDFPRFNPGVMQT